MKPGRELDKLISEKIFGEKFRPYTQLITTMPSKTVPETPFYSTNISAAWEVVEKIKAHQTIEIIGNSYYGQGDATGYSVKINGRLCSHQAETAALAICLAALEAIK